MPITVTNYSASLKSQVYGVDSTMYPFMTLEDNTEIVHSEMRPDGSVNVYMERPDEKDCFHHATCYLPDYRWEDVFGFSQEEISRYQKVIESTMKFYC